MRTDLHRPSTIQPQEYDYVSCDYLGGGVDSMAFLSDRMFFREHQKRTGGTWSHHEHGGTCHVCGAHAMYVARFHHRPSNAYIQTGMDCAEKMDMGDATAFRSFKKRIAAGRKTFKGKARAQELLADRQLNTAWTIYTATYDAPLPREESIITDIVSKVVRYGSISDKQANFVGKLLSDISNRAQRTAQREAEKAAAAPLPVSDQRITIRGEVVSTKLVDGFRGSVLKMLVRHQDGWKVWGTVPAGLSVERGDTVEFSAKVQPSRDDPKFGFFSRPTQARKIGPADDQRSEDGDGARTDYSTGSAEPEPDYNDFSGDNHQM
jgi:hypothetical protein